MAITIGLPLSRFHDREDRHPDKCFLVQPLAGGPLQALSWSQVGNQARRAAHWLRRQGLPPGSKVAIISNSCAHWIIADLAIWMAGHVSVPLDPDMGAGSVAQVLEHSGAALVMVGKLDDWAAMSHGVRAGLPTVALPISPEGSFDFHWDELQAWTPIQDNPVGRHEQLATIIYTCSADRRPQGVMHSFGALAFAATHGIRFFGQGEKDRLLSCLPLSQMAQRMFVELAAIYTGQTVFFTESPETFLNDLKRARPTVLLNVPSLWNAVPPGVYSRIASLRLEILLTIPLVGTLVAQMIRKRLGLGSLRIVLRDVAQMPRSLRRWYQQLGVKVLEVYGLTENCACSHMCKPGRQQGEWICQPCPQVEVRIAEDGEVLVRSEATMQGYFKDPLKTAKAMTADGFLHTGDEGELDRQGNLWLKGRLAEALAQVPSGER
jgi:long-subunit acyl-CoA synthetase (AMP-forming)